jgi:hypothetical protein
MKIVIPKLILSIGLLTAWLLPIGATVQANQGHHQSGIIGQVVGLPTFIDQCHVRIVSSDGGKVDTDIVTDSDLTFAVALKPGVYTLFPYVVNTPPLFIPPGSPIVVRVEKKDIEEMTLLYAPQPQ